MFTEIVRSCTSVEDMLNVTATCHRFRTVIGDTNALLGVPPPANDRETETWMQRFRLAWRVERDLEDLEDAVEAVQQRPCRSTFVGLRHIYEQSRPGSTRPFRAGMTRYFIRAFDLRMRVSLMLWDVMHWQGLGQHVRLRSKEDGFVDEWKYALDELVLELLIKTNAFVNVPGTLRKLAPYYTLGVSGHNVKRWVRWLLSHALTHRWSDNKITPRIVDEIVDLVESQRRGGKKRYTSYWTRPASS
jgi:hypothetical protein